MEGFSARSGQSSSMSSSNGFNVYTSKSEVNGYCVATVHIEGNGVSKRVELPCDEGTPSVINVNGALLVGEYFTDTPGELVHLSEGTCSREVFTQVGGQYTSSVEPMSSQDCERVRSKVEALREQGDRLNERTNELQLQTQQRIQNLQQRMQNMRGRLLGGIMGRGLLGNNQ